MKRFLNALVFVGVFTVCLCSCEIAIDLGDDGLGRVLLMNAQMSTADTTHTIYLATSEQTGFSSVKQAVISCYVNGTLVNVSDTIDDVEEIGYFAKQSVSVLHIKASFAPGDLVCIKASSGDLHCEAEVTVPAAPVILDAKVEKCVSDYDCSMGDYKFTVDIEDLKDEYNYYFLNVLDVSYVVVTKTDSHWYKAGYIMNRQDELPRFNTEGEPLLHSSGIGPSIGNSYNSYFNNKQNLFSDASFRDSRYNLKFYSTRGFSITPRTMSTGEEMISHNIAVIQIFNISKDEYLYQDCYQFDNSSESGTFLTNELVYPCNVTGGLGFVSINAATEYVLNVSSFLHDIDHFSHGIPIE